MSIIRKIALGVALLLVLWTKMPTVARADVDMTDYNTYWQVAADPTPPDPSLDYNTYWAEVQAKQQWQDRFGN
jgi:hypothetical protein